MRRWHLDNTTFFVFPKCVILKRENGRVISQHMIFFYHSMKMVLQSEHMGYNPIFLVTSSHFATLRWFDLHTHIKDFGFCIIRCHLHCKRWLHYTPLLGVVRGFHRESWMESILPSKGSHRLGFSWVGWVVSPLSPPLSYPLIATHLLFCLYYVTSFLM